VDGELAAYVGAECGDQATRNEITCREARSVCAITGGAYRLCDESGNYCGQRASQLGISCRVVRGVEVACGRPERSVIAFAAAE
jgi:hypothetical protein